MELKQIKQLGVDAKTELSTNGETVRYFEIMVQYHDEYAIYYDNMVGSSLTMDDETCTRKWQWHCNQMDKFFIKMIALKNEIILKNHQFIVENGLQSKSNDDKTRTNHQNFDYYDNIAYQIAISQPFDAKTYNDCIAKRNTFVNDQYFIGDNDKTYNWQQPLLSKLHHENDKCTENDKPIKCKICKNDKCIDMGLYDFDECENKLK